jgi:hypothetical protein
MELKVVCDCGQKYKFDVEPVGGRMPYAVSCPACNTDGTAAANALLATQLPAAPTAIPAPPPVPPASAGLRIKGQESAAPTAVALPPAPAGLPVPPIRPLAAAKPAKSAEFNMGLGILGAVLGAGLGAGLMFGFFLLVHFRFPWLGLGIGALSGYGARLLGRGTETVLGVITAGIALLSVGGTLYLIYGEIPVINILSMIVSVSVAYRLASG